jgi:uncharacterized membrane protein (GlpM family)
MNFKNLVFNFAVGGTITALIVGFEESKMKTLSGIAALMPVFTLVSYFIMGASQDAKAISEHAKFVLWGTIIAWIPYMTAIAIYAPKLGTNKSILLGMAIFFACASVYVFAAERFHLFDL